MIRVSKWWYKTKWFRENYPWYVRVWKIISYYMRLTWSCICEPFIRLRNFILVKRFPFLQPSCGWYTTMFYWPEGYKYRYEETWLDCLPRGWRKAFGIQLCKELKKAIDDNHLENYAVHQVKEKWGELCWYDEGGNKNTYEIVEKYEILSHEKCKICGRPTEYMTRDWIGYYCGRCARKFKDFNTNNVTPKKLLEK